MTEAPNNPTTPAPASQAGGSPPAQPAGSGAPVRPEGLPEKFWNAEKGVLHDEIVKDVTTRATAEAERAKAVPESADKYKIQLPATFQVPQGLTFNIDEADPMFGFARKFAATQKLTQSELDGIVGEYAALQLQQHQAATTRAAEQDRLIAADLEKLGPTKDVRIKAVEDALSVHFGNDDAAKKVAKIIAHDIGSSEVITAFEKLITKLASGGPAVSGSGREQVAQPQTMEDRWYGKAA